MAGRRGVMGGSRDSLYLNGVTGSFDYRVVVFGIPGSLEYNEF